MQLDFIIYEMTALRYFIPIIIEANRVNIKCNFFCNWSAKKKYSNLRRNKKELEKISKKYKISLFIFNEILKRNNPILTIEDVGLDDLNRFNDNQKIFSIYYSGDFIRLYSTYIDKIEHSLLISKFFANYYDCQSSKNLYFGSPKFDINLEKKEILEKYKLNEDDRYALVFYPKIRDRNKINIKDIYSVLRELNFKIIVKLSSKK